MSNIMPVIKPGIKLPCFKNKIKKKKTTFVWKYL